MLWDRGSLVWSMVALVLLRGVLCPARYTHIPPPRLQKVPMRLIHSLPSPGHCLIPISDSLAECNHYFVTGSLLYSGNNLFRDAETARLGLKHHLLLFPHPPARRRAGPRLLSRAWAEQITAHTPSGCTDVPRLPLTLAARAEHRPEGF